jgi:hypothetical protein
MALAILQTAWNYEYDDVGENLWVPRRETEPFRQKATIMIKISESGWDWNILVFTSRKHPSLQTWNVNSSEKNKERISELFYASPDDSHRLTSIIVGKSGRPRVLKNCMNQLPVIYKV